MRSLLNALQEGRLIELPDNNKDKAMEYLALLLEAVPDIGSKTDLVKGSKEREAQYNTGLGNGVAIPHIRTSLDGELLCAVGWSPQGIEYGAPDGKKVYLMIMYYIPDSEKNLYLKEISGLAKVIKKIEAEDFFTNVKDIHSLRDKLLDWVGFVINEAVPDSMAKMIKLEAKQAAVESKEAIIEPLKIISRIIPFNLVVFDKNKYMILSQDTKLIESLERTNEIMNKISTDLEFESSGYKIAVRSAANFANNRKFYECVAVK